VPIPGAGTGAKATQGKNYDIYHKLFLNSQEVWDHLCLLLEC